MKQVASFIVDHTKLDPGIYRQGASNGTQSWDLRFVAPRDKKPLSPGAVHVIEHVFAQGLRQEPVFGEKVVAFCPMGCLTGFYLITDNSATDEMVAAAVYLIAASRFPLKDKTDVPAMNEVQCGNPDLADISGANEAIKKFIEQCLKK